MADNQPAAAAPEQGPQSQGGQGQQPRQRGGSAPGVVNNVASGAVLVQPGGVIYYTAPTTGGAQQAQPANALAAAPAAQASPAQQPIPQPVVQAVIPTVPPPSNRATTEPVAQGGSMDKAVKVAFIAGIVLLGLYFLPDILGRLGIGSAQYAAPMPSGGYQLPLPPTPSFAPATVPAQTTPQGQGGGPRAVGGTSGRPGCRPYTPTSQSDPLCSWVTRDDGRRVQRCPNTCS